MVQFTCTWFYINCRSNQLGAFCKRLLSFVHFNSILNETFQRCIYSYNLQSNLKKEISNILQNFLGSIPNFWQKILQWKINCIRCNSPAEEYFILMHHHFHFKTAKFKPSFGANGPSAWRDIYRATTAV